MHTIKPYVVYASTRCTAYYVYTMWFSCLISLIYHMCHITGARAGGGRGAGPRGGRGGRCAVLYYDALCGRWGWTEVCIRHSNACIIFYYMYRISYELMRHCTHHMYTRLIYITHHTHVYTIERSRRIWTAAPTRSPAARATPRSGAQTMQRV